MRIQFGRTEARRLGLVNRIGLMKRFRRRRGGLRGLSLALSAMAGRRAVDAAVEAALRRLEDPESDRETTLRAATLLVLHAFVPEGSTERAFDPAAVERRLGRRLRPVLAVERYLVRRRSAPPTFTRGGGEV